MGDAVRAIERMTRRLVEEGAQVHLDARQRAVVERALGRTGA